MGRLAESLMTRPVDLGLDLPFRAGEMLVGGEAMAFRIDEAGKGRRINVFKGFRNHEVDPSVPSDVKFASLKVSYRAGVEGVQEFDEWALMMLRAGEVAELVAINYPVAGDRPSIKFYENEPVIGRGERHRLSFAAHVEETEGGLMVDEWMASLMYRDREGEAKQYYRVGRNLAESMLFWVRGEILRRGRL